MLPCSGLCFLTGSPLSWGWISATVWASLMAHTQPVNVMLVTCFNSGTFLSRDCYLNCNWVIKIRHVPGLLGLPLSSSSKFSAELTPVPIMRGLVRLWLLLLPPASWPPSSAGQAAPLAEGDNVWFMAVCVGASRAFAVVCTSAVSQEQPTFYQVSPLGRSQTTLCTIVSSSGPITWEVNTIGSLR